jgi:hypothetical protein
MHQMTRTSLLALLAGATLTGTAGGQLQFFRVASDDINDLRDTSGTNPLLVGSTIYTVAFDGTDIYVAGFNGAANPWVQIGHIIDVFAGGSNRSGLIDFSSPLTPAQNVALSSRRVAPGSRGYASMDWFPGQGLLAVYDGGSASLGSLLTYDTETQATPIVSGSSTVAVRGLGAGAWDPGPDGNGYDTDGDGISDGPVPSFLLQPVDANGPLGLVRPTLSTALGSAVYAANPGPGEAQGPILEFAPGTTDRAGLGGTFWRGFDISPSGEFMVAVADADLVIARRDLMNNVMTRIVVESAPGAGGDAPFIVDQQCTFVDNYDGQDFIVYNRRLAGGAGQSFAGNARFVTTAGTPLTVELFDEAGLPLTLPDGVGLYDFAWHEPSQTFVVLDGSANIVHLFRPEPAGPTRLCADQNNDGQVSGTDFSAFVANFNTQNLLADVNQDGAVTPTDFSAWVGAFNQGANGPLCP